MLTEILAKQAFCLFERPRIIAVPFGQINFSVFRPEKTEVQSE